MGIIWFSSDKNEILSGESEVLYLKQRVEYTGYAGTQEYCKRLNFKGMCTSLPFDIKETKGMKINEKPLVYPEHCGALLRRQEI